MKEGVFRREGEEKAFSVSFGKVENSKERRKKGRERYTEGMSRDERRIGREDEGLQRQGMRGRTGRGQIDRHEGNKGQDE